MLPAALISRQTRINLILPIAAIVSIGLHSYNPQHRPPSGLLTDFCPGDLAEQVQTFLARIAERLLRVQDARRSSCAAQAKNDKLSTQGRLQTLLA